jgi:hypothetical protein
MQPDHDHHDCYCLICHAPAEEAAESCVQCRASFLGSGGFDKVRGPRPSSMFLALFAAPATDRAAELDRAA